MSIEANKKLARQFFDALNRGDHEAVLGLYTDDGALWTAGTLPFSGTHVRDEIGPFMAGILGVFPEGLSFTLKNLTAEGDRVAIEAESRGLHASGQIYTNQYHFLMIVKDGRVRELKEYLDTQRAKEILVDAA